MTANREVTWGELVHTKSKIGSSENGIRVSDLEDGIARNWAIIYRKLAVHRDSSAQQSYTIAERTAGRVINYNYTVHKRTLGRLHVGVAVP